MRLFILFCIPVCVAIASCGSSETETKPKHVSNHSAEFNGSVGALMSNYYSLTEGFVNWDTAAINKQAKIMSVQIEHLDLNDLKRDSSVYQTANNKLTNAKFDLSTIEKEQDIANKRHALNDLTDHLFSFLKTAKFDQAPLYLQECPMAFNEKDTGLWLSKSSDIRNPYMGVHHPHYGKAMLECGDTRDSLDLTK
ncbi:MAG TPA: DUF3347 domain-containing protein [Flavisolibacter sp.]|nr:DUF3347 domain-containing protein [Flavisolibacter sp.]